MELKLRELENLVLPDLEYLIGHYENWLVYVYISKLFMNWYI